MTWQRWQTRSAIALAATSSPNTFPQPPMPTLAAMIVERCSQRVEMSWKSRSAPPEDNPFQMAEDLRRLRRENERLKRENEILLKASAFFASRQL